MTLNRRYALRASLAGLLIAVTLSLGADAPKHSAVTPVPRDAPWWQARQASFNERVAKGNVDLIFIGDSITHGWEGEGKSAWAARYAKRNAVNLGIGGDQTQHVLYRLANGNIKGINPKAAVIMIGTNNGGSNSSQEIAEGITAIVTQLRENLPNTKILLLAIFPRGESPNPLREKLTQTNSLISKLDDGKHVFFLDIGANLMNPDGTIFKEIMPDFLHLSAKGYDIWANSIEEKLAQLMGEK